MVAGTTDSLRAQRDRPQPAARPIRRLRAARRRFSTRISRLTIRILAINLLSVAILFIGVLYLDRYQNSLIRGELAALDRQAAVLARAVAELAGGTDALVGPGLGTERGRRPGTHGRACC